MLVGFGSHLGAGDALVGHVSPHQQLDKHPPALAGWWGAAVVCFTPESWGLMVRGSGDTREGSPHSGLWFCWRKEALPLVCLPGKRQGLCEAAISKPGSLWLEAGLDIGLQARRGHKPAAVRAQLTLLQLLLLLLIKTCCSTGWTVVWQVSAIPLAVGFMLALWGWQQAVLQLACIQRRRRAEEGQQRSSCGGWHCLCTPGTHSPGKEHLSLEKRWLILFSHSIFFLTVRRAAEHLGAVCLGYTGYVVFDKDEM